MNASKLKNALKTATKKASKLHHSLTLKTIVDQAKEARNKGQFLAAARLFESALPVSDNPFRFHMQSGHMYKEARDLANAKKHYLAALKVNPNDAEIYLQLGHFYKLTGDYQQAEQFYQKAVDLRPDWDLPLEELLHLRNSPELRHQKERIHFAQGGKEFPKYQRAVDNVDTAYVNPALFPQARETLFIDHENKLVMTWDGNRQTTEWGTAKTFFDVSSIRGHFLSDVPVQFVEIYLDGELIYKKDLTGAPIFKEKSNPNMQKYSFNAWIDFSRYERGWHNILIRGVNIREDSRQGISWFEDRIIVERAQSSVFSNGPAYVAPLDPASPLSIEEQINSRPSIVRKASTNSLPGKTDNILVMRLDQLGDMVITVPALLSLRKLFPKSRITALVTGANTGLARSLGIFDEVLTIDFPDDPLHQRRTMGREGQEALRKKLAPYKFDIAIDFPVSGESYRLLPLTGAPVVIGFCGGNKIVDVSVSAHDPKTNSDFMRHSARTQLLVETLRLMQDSGAQVVRRDDLKREMLVPYGVGVDEDYAVLHSGSRVKFARWQYFPELATKIIHETGKKVVFFADDNTLREHIPQEYLDSGKVIYLTGQIPFDDFDALLSFCSVYFGNDSGPKHLASLRGANMVSINPGRNNWQEWGQEQSGVIIIRQVPCGSCNLHHHPEECAQEFACVKYISLDEVYNEVVKFL